MNVKLSALERLSHATGADIVTNLEHLKTARIGFSKKFEEQISAGGDSLLLCHAGKPNFFFTGIISGDNVGEL